MFQERSLIGEQCPSQAWPRAEATQEAAALGDGSLAVPESGWGHRGHAAFELPSELCCFKFIQAHPLCSSHPPSSSRHGSNKNFGGKVWLLCCIFIFSAGWLFVGTPELPPVALCSFEKRHWSVLRGTRSVAGLLGQSLMYALTSGVGRLCFCAAKFPGRGSKH